MPTITPYDPNNPLQANFLNAIAAGENPRGDPWLGVGNVNLQSAPRNQYGFPQWAGRMFSTGISHAAGLFQFQPGTWASFARRYGLNFANPRDQAAGAWYDAQEVFARRTGGDLTAALQAGNYAQIQSALAQEWTSASSGPGGNLANRLAGSAGASGALGVGGTAPASGGVDLGAAVNGFFVRGGLIIVGGAIILIALWALLANAGVVPSAKDVAGSAAKVAAAIV